MPDLQAGLLLKNTNLPESESKKRYCALCSLPVGRSKIRQASDTEVFHFCCPGCFNVFQILSKSTEIPASSFKETELYRACVASGIIPKHEQDIAQREAEQEQYSQLPVSAHSLDEDLACELDLRIGGMWCTACAWLIREVLGKKDGILSTTIHFLSDQLIIKYLPYKIGTEEIQLIVSKLGYSTYSLSDRTEQTKEKRDLLVRLGLSIILTMNVMMISFALYFGFFGELGKEGITYFSYPLWLLTTPVLFYAGYPILRRAWVGLRFYELSMDTLISLGSLSAYLYSIIQMGMGSIQIYFDTSAMLITVVLLGRYIESRARERISRGINALYRMASGKVRLWKDGREHWATSEALEPGVQFVVSEGERILADGRIIFGRAELDESILTGESKPVKKLPGEDVMAGALVSHGSLGISTTRLGKESSVGQMITLMQDALATKDPSELLADRITRFFVPAVIMVAFTTFLYLISHGSTVDSALLRAITVLVITCPCALGIATPLAKVASIGTARERGVAVRDPAALEEVKDLDTIVFDKTGTLTEGSYSIREVITSGIGEEEALRRVGSVELISDHFIAREVVRKATERFLTLEEPESFETIEGRGVKGILQCGEVYVGNRSFMSDCALILSTETDECASRFESAGMSVVFFGWDSSTQGFLVLGDKLKENAREAVTQLCSRGLKVHMISGDSEATTRAIAGEVGISSFLGQAIPGRKVEFIKQLQNAGFRVGMVGDGINDTAALVQANVGFAIGTGANIAQEASDITLIGSDPLKLVEIIRLSSATSKTIRHNVFFAFIYNVFGLPLAISGFLNPLIAVFAMFASSATVIWNTLRLSRY